MNGGAGRPRTPRYIKGLLYIFKDFECQPDCRPTSKSFKGGLYVPRWAT